jgi:hypothetical protein
VEPVRKLTHEGAKKRAERERQIGLDPEDEAAKWLDEQDPQAPPPEPKSRFKSRELHRWRQRQQKREPG